MPSLLSKLCGCCLGRREAGELPDRLAYKKQYSGIDPGVSLPDLPQQDSGGHVSPADLKLELADLPEEASDPGEDSDDPVQESDYEYVKELGAGAFGSCALVKHTKSGKEYAIKYLPRGREVDATVEREIINHSTLRHPHIVQFERVFLTPSHLAIVMEPANGGELFDRILNAGGLPEPEARYFFQQLVAGVGYLHAQNICHRDLKPENMLLESSPKPKVKICDFGYSKSSVLDSKPKSAVGTISYMAPEVLLRQVVEKDYDGAPADVWSLGVTLYTMVCGCLPFVDAAQPRNANITVHLITTGTYTVPGHVSKECRDLLARLLVTAPRHRIKLPEVRRHPWFLRDPPPPDPAEEPEGPGAGAGRAGRGRWRAPQSEDRIRAVIQEAKRAGQSPAPAPAAAARQEGAGSPPCFPTGGYDAGGDDEEDHVYEFASDTASDGDLSFDERTNLT